MADKKTCLRCGGSNLEPGVIESDKKVNFCAKHTKFMTLQLSDIAIDASICMDCGTLDLVGDVTKARSLIDRIKPVR